MTKSLVLALLLSASTAVPVTFANEAANDQPTSAISDEAPAMTEEELQYMQWAESLWENIDRQTGTINLNSAGATLNVPEDFYFLNSKDAETVLVDVWGNPPGQQVLGMLFSCRCDAF